jgi:YVTN family beta-propeller protein
LKRRRLIYALSGLSLLASTWLGAQTPPSPAASPAPANPFLLSPEDRARMDQLSREDHADMMRQLGITKLRPGANGRAAAGEPGAANYDPTKANPYPDWPDVLTSKDGRKVTTAEMWWRQRRPEIAEDFEREVYGRVPKGVPNVAWTVAETVETTVGGQAVVARRVIGHVDNSAHSAISVDIKMAVVVPVNAKGPVPVLMMFGWGNMPGEPLPRFPGVQEPAAPPSTAQLIAAGWGYVSLSTASIQADNGAGLTAGIIGLANKGQRRTPEQWGSLRAWAWGAARALDYLETLPAVDAKRVGIEGVSRYGKAALVTMAFEPRFAVALVGSSGEGGAKPHRRNFGEAVENLTGSGEYHWMAGSFLKYGAADSSSARRGEAPPRSSSTVRFADASSGSKNASDIPVDAHELIALCAPRPTFISYGIPEKGDANWLDQQGSYMATIAAGPVFRLLGARDTGVMEDYRVAKMPPVNTSLLDGELAWRQHDGGHEDRSNMSFFIAWANRLLGQSHPSAVLLVLSKSDRTVSIVDPATLKVLARMPSGPDPHEIVADADGKLAYISNYGGVGGAYNTISVVDLLDHKALTPIDLGALRGAHGLAFAGGKVWFTAETNKVIGSYDPATKRVDWVLGTGQNRTHMIALSDDLKRIVTSNVSSATMSIIDKISRPGPRGPQEDWDQTVVPVGRGAEGFDVTPDGKQIWAANAQDGTISVLDAAEKRVVDTLSVNVRSANRLKFTPDGSLVFVSTLNGPELVIVDARTRREVKRLPIGRGAAGIQMQPDGARAYVACTPDDSVAVIDLKSLEVAGHIEAGKQPDGLAWVVRR